MKSIENALCIKKREFEKSTKENELLHNEIDMSNAELDSCKMKYQHEMKACSIKLSNLQLDFYLYLFY